MSVPPHPGTGGAAGIGLPPGGSDLLGALEHYEGSLASLRAGLVVIESSPSFLMLTDADLAGETARRYGLAARDAANLWELLDAGAALLGAARNHVATQGSTGAAAPELRRLLNEPWYSVAIGRGQPRSFSATGVLSEIRRRYDAIRSAVADIDQLWVSILPRVDAARATLIRLQSEVDELGVPEPLVGRARALAEDLAERLIDDPASVHPQDGANLDLQVSEAAKLVATMRTKHDDLDVDLGSTEELLASLRVLRARAEASGREAASKVADPGGLVRVPGEAVLDGPDGLAARLDQLFDDAAGSNWSRKRNLLDAWLSSARRLEAQLIRAGETNRAPVEARNELRGRLRAYNAKMAATGRAEDLALADVADRARSLLYTAPADLEAAEAAIADLAARLRQ